MRDSWLSGAVSPRVPPLRAGNRQNMFLGFTSPAMIEVMVRWVPI